MASAIELRHIAHTHRSMDRDIVFMFFANLRTDTHTHADNINIIRICDNGVGLGILAATAAGNDGHTIQSKSANDDCQRWILMFYRKLFAKPTDEDIS